MNRAPAFTLLTRENCGLCMELRAALHEFAAGRPYTCDIRDVDEDPGTRTRWGARIPVLLLDAQVVSEGHVDTEQLGRAFAPD